MLEKWIGEEVNTSGSYVATECPELLLRKGGVINSPKLYRFNTRFNERYNITDEESILEIEKLLENYEPMKMYEYLYGLVIDKFGVMEFILNIGHYSRRHREDGYIKGKEQMQKEIRELLGIKSESSSFGERIMIRNEFEYLE